jgi:hypothetical protein
LRSLDENASTQVIPLPVNLFGGRERMNGNHIIERHQLTVDHSKR